MESSLNVCARINYTHKIYPRSNAFTTKGKVAFLYERGLNDAFNKSWLKAPHIRLHFFIRKLKLCYLSGVRNPSLLDLSVVNNRQLVKK